MGTRPTILTYHEITAVPSPYFYSTTAEMLDLHLVLLAPLSAEITFDDGHVSQCQRALPVLEKHGRKAIFFITAGWTGTKPEYMTGVQLRELASYGHEVQSHGWSHTFLNACSSDDLRQELKRSRDVLEQLVGVPVTAISAPGGRWNRRVLAVAAEVGYRRFYTSNPYLRPHDRLGLLVSGRHMIKNTTRPEDLSKFLLQSPLAVFRGAMRYRIKQVVKAVVGERCYQTIWDKFAKSDARK